jgi:small subunit ribosomal protein S16
VAVKIKLKRLGRTRVPTYRIVVADARTKRDGRAIEEIGKYHPKEEPSFIEVNSERAQHWLSVGAQPTEPVMTILKITGDWQKFKGEPGADGTLRTKEPAADKKERFATALKDAAKDGTATAAPKGGSRARKPDTAKADTAKADSGKTGAKASDTAKAEVKPESGQAKSKASAETTAAGSADDSVAAAAASGETTEATAAAGAAESSEPGSGA